MAQEPCRANAQFLSQLDTKVAIEAWMQIALQSELPSTERIRAAYHALQDGEPQARQILWQIGEDTNYPSDQRLSAADALKHCGYTEDARLIYMILSQKVLSNRQVGAKSIRELTRPPR